MSEDRDAVIDSLQETVKRPDRPSGHMSLEEIKESLEQVARDPDDRDRFKALKMLASMDAAGAVLPEPLGNAEVVERLARLMKPCGTDMCHVAYRRAFPQSRNQIGDAAKIFMDDLPPEDLKTVDRVRSLKTLYRLFPEIKGPGVPRGYPMRGSISVRAEWCKRAAARILLEKRQTAATKAVESGNVPD